MSTPCEAHRGKERVHLIGVEYRAQPELVVGVGWLRRSPASGPTGRMGSGERERMATPRRCEGRTPAGAPACVRLQWNSQLREETDNT